MATASSGAPDSSGGLSFFEQHEFFIRRLHSFTGLMAGGFMCVHLMVNASVLNSPETFQNNVYSIHALGKLLPLVEWAFIFAPLLFHAIVGVWIANNAAFNTGHYRYGPNYRYTIQRITGYVLFLFFLYHVFHMHGWFHWDWWLAIVESLGGHAFRPYNATSTAGAALQNWVIVAIYTVGILCGVYHFANGVWTAGITWGLWTTPESQKGALKVCGGLGAALAVVGMSALFGVRPAGTGEKFDETVAAENQMYETRVKAGMVLPNEHKRYHAGDGHAGDEHSDEEHAAVE